MKKNKLLLIFLSLLAIGIINHSKSQIVLTLQPGATEGKDVKIHSLDTYTSGSANELPVAAWTFGGTPGLYHSLIYFDLSSIHVPSVVLNAELYLYGEPGLPSGGHSTLGGSNECVIQRITGPWDEDTVTWGSHPTVSLVNQVITAASTNEYQDFIFNVTDLVQDMVDNPANSFGFMIKQLTEVHYRRMVFCSSDHANSTLHPKLIISYVKTTAVNECMNLNTFDVYPNPASDLINIRHESEKEVLIEIYNTQGQLLLSKLINEKVSLIDISKLTEGCYIVKLTTNNNTQTRKIVKY